MRQRILGSHTPPCHRRMVITTQFSVLPCCTAAQTSSVPLQVAADCALALAVCTFGSARTHKGAMRQRKLGSHTPPCHRRMVITTLFSVLLAALQRRPALYHTRWLLAVHWHRGQLAPTTHPQCRLVSNPCPAGREVVSYSILRGAMAPWLAQRRLSISSCAPSVRQLNKSLLLCVWRIPRLLPTLHAHAAHTFMPTCFRLPHMRRTLAAPVVLWLCNT